ncbi:3701_t:CDS:2, partial [Cetraspora pellucida]
SDFDEYIPDNYQPKKKKTKTTKIKRKNNKKNNQKLVKKQKNITKQITRLKEIVDLFDNQKDFRNWSSDTKRNILEREKIQDSINDSAENDIMKIQIEDKKNNNNENISKRVVIINPGEFTYGGISFKNCNK